MRIKELTDYKQVSAFLDRVYMHLNRDFFNNELPKAVVTVMSDKSAYGYFITGQVWQSGNDGLYEINIGAEGISRGTDRTVATLMHEMVHFYCHLNGIQDTSRQGRYHNKIFKTECEKRLLHIDFDKKIGWSVTYPSDDLKRFIRQHKYPKINIYRTDVIGSDAPEKISKPSSTRKYICSGCGNSVRATKEINIICGDCNISMLEG